MIPWGNAYFNTTKCGRPEYDRAQVDCYRTLCANDGAPDCFTGPVLCQHGASECFGNRLEGCLFVNANFATWYPFVDCFEKDGDLSKRNAEACAQKAGLDYTQMEKCVRGTQGDQVDVANAKATLAYSGNWLGTPTVTVAGKTVADPSTGLVKAICKAYKGSWHIKACRTLE